MPGTIPNFAIGDSGFSMTWRKINRISSFNFHSCASNRSLSSFILQVQQASRLSKARRSPNHSKLHTRRLVSTMPGLVSNGPHAHSGEAHPSLDSMNHSNRIPNRLILCFDGTGNEFLGNTGDTNIVKLYNKFDRSAPHQMHYYQRKQPSP